MTSENNVRQVPHVRLSEVKRAVSTPVELKVKQLPHLSRGYVHTFLEEVREDMSSATADNLHVRYEMNGPEFQLYTTLNGVVIGKPGDYLVEEPSGESWITPGEVFDPYYENHDESTPSRKLQALIKDAREEFLKSDEDNAVWTAERDDAELMTRLGLYTKQSLEYTGQQYYDNLDALRESIIESRGEFPIASLRGVEKQMDKQLIKLHNAVANTKEGLIYDRSTKAPITDLKYLEVVQKLARESLQEEFGEYVN